MILQLLDSITSYHVENRCLMPVSFFENRFHPELDVKIPVSVAMDLGLLIQPNLFKQKL